MKINKCLNMLSVLSLSLLVAGCKKTTITTAAKKENDNIISYDELYDGTSKEIHKEITDPLEFNRASYAYKFNTVQGYSNWYFLKEEGTESETLFNEEGIWKDFSGNSLNDGVVNTNGSSRIVYCYKAKSAGNYSFGFTFKSVNEKSSGGTVKVYKNNSLIYPEEGEIRVDGSDLTGYYIEGSTELTGTDELKIVVSGNNVYCNPSVVKKNSMYDSLYNSHNSWIYYGDIHGYYYKGILHLYHLWNFGSDGGWKWFMQNSTDMFRFVDSGYDDSFIKNHYMCYGTDPDVFTEDYTSSRDRTYFYDEQSEVYRSIGLCYSKPDTGSYCDLALRSSDDKMGFEWTQKSVPLRRFITQADGEPECSQLLHIGNRWYLSCGISGQTDHGVGGFSYWMGGSDETIDEVDWQSLETLRLDGEDLCVPQIVEMGGRYYLYGWMPQQYNGSYWGGYKNLSREVYVNEDGTLGTRIDEKATLLLNKGKFYDIEENSISSRTNAAFSDNQIIFNGAGELSFNKTINSSFVKYSVEFKDASEVSFVLSSDTKTKIYVSLYKENGSLYAKVYDESNYVSSTLLITNKDMNSIDCKLIAEGGIIEFSVGDMKVLSARTKQGYLDYYPGFKTNGSAVISNIEFDRLAQYYDVYD